PVSQRRRAVTELRPERRSAGMDLEITDRALRAGPVDLQREAPGGSSCEMQLYRGLGPEPGLEIIAVDVERERLVGGPLECDLVALPDPNEPLALGELAVLEPAVEV